MFRARKMSIAPLSVKEEKHTAYCIQCVSVGTFIKHMD